MKKQAMSLLVAVTVAFAGFTAGYYLGRSHSPGDVQLALPAAMLTEPAQPASEETAPPQETEETTIAFPIDLNTAGEAELAALPGIGPVLARRILDYRQEVGALRSVEELLNVSGIGEKRLEAIWDYVTVGGLPYEDTGG